MKGNVEFVGGPLCGKIARGYVGEPEVLTDWHEGDVVTYRRRDRASFDARPFVSAGGNRMYDFERMASV